MRSFLEIIINQEQRYGYHLEMVSINSKKPPSEWEWGQIEYYRKAFENYETPADKEWSEGLLLQTEADRDYHSPNLRRGFQLILKPLRSQILQTKVL